MDRTFFTRCALIALLIGIQSHAALAVAPQASFGTKLGTLGLEGGEFDLNVDVKNRASLMRVAPYIPASLQSVPTDSVLAFVGSGASPTEMIHPATFSADIDYAALLYGYLNHIDPGGQMTRVEFYEDDSGCQTDVLTRKAKDGTTHTYIIDSTGWLDGVLPETPKRHCAR